MLLFFFSYKFTIIKKYGKIYIEKEKVIIMLCPHCHAENNYDALTCDFCLQEIPLTEARKKEKKLV